MLKKTFTAIALTAALAGYASTTPAIAKTVIPMAQGGGPGEDRPAHATGPAYDDHIAKNTTGLAGADAALGAAPSGYSSWGAITDPAAAFAAQPSAYTVSGKQQKQPKTAQQRPSDQSN